MIFIYDKMPVMTPIRIPTKGKNLFQAIWLWLMTTRTWELHEDWRFTISGCPYIIPRGFVFDGASVPKYFRSWLSPMGILLIPGLIHDFGYKHGLLIQEPTDGGYPEHFYSRRAMDEIFLNVAVEVNGFALLNFTAWLMVRLFGWIPWNAHRKAGLKS